MKMKLKEVGRHLEDLAALGKRVFPAKLSYAISCNMDVLAKEMEHVQQERKSICESYAEKDGEGNPITVDSMVKGKKVREYKLTDENKRQLNEEYEAFLEMGVDIEIRKVKTDILEECEKKERYSIPTVADMAALSFMLEE